MIYHYNMRVGFHHCDAAKIVFYPKFLEMANMAVEEFFRDVIGYPYEQMIDNDCGIPVAQLNVSYRRPSRLGEILNWQLEIKRLGNSAIDFQFEVYCQEEHRLSISLTQVHASFPNGALPWPAPVREALLAFQQDQ